MSTVNSFIHGSRTGRNMEMEIHSYNQNTKAIFERQNASPPGEVLFLTNLFQVLHQQTP